MSAEKDQALVALCNLVQTCQSASTTLRTLTHSVSNAKFAPIPVLRNDMLSLNRLIHSSTTRLSIALGKPPPSYHVALVPLKDLTNHVAQLSSCVSALPPGALRKEAVWAAEELVHALATLAQHFEGRCRQQEDVGDEYLAKTGAVHDAVAKTEKISSDESEAVAKAWRIDADSLEDSLKEINDMVEETGAEDNQYSVPVDDGWDELGEGFGRKLDPDAIARVKKICPFLRFTTLLHARILSHHILKPPASGSHPGPHLARLLQLSESLPPASDDLVSALYAPQDLESIRESVEAVHQIVENFRRELDTDDETARQAFEQLKVHDNGEAKDSNMKTQEWFQRCFSQINIVHKNLNI